MPYARGNTLPVQFDKKPLVPHSVKCFLIVNQGDIGLLPSLSTRLDCFLEDEGSMEGTVSLGRKPPWRGFRCKSMEWSLRTMSFSKSLEMLERKVIPLYLAGSDLSLSGPLGIGMI